MLRKFLILLAFGFTTLIVTHSPVLSSDRQMTLDYKSSYTCQCLMMEPDHLMDVIAVDENRVIVPTALGIEFFDLATLPQEGGGHYPMGSQYLYRLIGLNSRNAYLKEDYLFVNLYPGPMIFPQDPCPQPGETCNTVDVDSRGFGVVKIVGNQLQYITTIEEPGVWYEKMKVDGDYLYVAAHSQGIRIYDISNPENPIMVGSLTTGFTDAWAIDVAHGLAFVADGGGGLKIVNITDKTNPVLLRGEEPDQVLGTAEDVSFRDGRIYVAAGGEGVLVFFGPGLRRRQVLPVGVAAKDLAWMDDNLVVATMSGFYVFDTANPFNIQLVARESTARRDPEGVLRICSAVGTAPGNRILAANWNYIDVYELKPFNQSQQPDIIASHQRIRFAPTGGTQTVTVENAGAGILAIEDVISTNPDAFSVNYESGTLLPGESVYFDIAYNGHPDGAGFIQIVSNDPDENPLPIQVFGETSSIVDADWHPGSGTDPDTPPESSPFPPTIALLDPGDPAVDFTLPLMKPDPVTGENIWETFTLSGHLGKVVVLQVYSSG